MKIKKGIRGLDLREDLKGIGLVWGGGGSAKGEKKMGIRTDTGFSIGENKDTGSDCAEEDTGLDCGRKIRD